MKPSRTRSLRLIFNLFIFLGTLYAFYLMYCRSEGNLQARGFEAFKYFTVQSNVFGGVMAAVWLTFAAAGRKRGKDIPRAVHLLKFAAAVSLGLTFLTVMVFLGRIYGYIPLLRGANLWFHLLVPLAAMAECVLFNREKISMKNCAASMLPMLLYALVYLVYNLVMGRSDDPFRYDWYGFLLWGWGVGVFIFLIICAGTFGIGALLRVLNICISKKSGEKNNT